MYGDAKGRKGRGNNDKTEKKGRRKGESKVEIQCQVQREAWKRDISVRNQEHYQECLLQTTLYAEVVVGVRYGCAKEIYEGVCKRACVCLCQYENIGLRTCESIQTQRVCEEHSEEKNIERNTE